MRPETSNIDIAHLPKTFSMQIPEKFRDEMGHMNVTWYTHLFSEAMGGLMSYLGLSSDYIKQEMIGGVALEAHIHYLAEVNIGDHVSVYSRILARSEKRMHMLHILHNENQNQVSSLFEGVMACFDLRSRRMAAIPEPIGSRLDEVLQQHGQLAWQAPLTGVMRP